MWSPEAFDHAMPKTQGKGYTTLAWKESQAEYYRLAGHALHEKEFKNIKLRLIWQLHSEGLTYVEIAEALNTTLDKVRRSVEKLAHEFCLK